MKSVNAPSLQRIISAVAKAQGLSVSDLTGGRRQAHIVKGRHMVMWVATYYTPATLSAIAAALGMRNHASVLWGRDQIDWDCQRASDRGESLHEWVRINCL
jgi:chromosomal replication initiation ATPase DnaA